MCTAISMKSDEHYFGRNLDLDCSYGEEVCVMPRNYPLFFRKAKEMPKHYAVIGMATVVDNIPLFYDATNEYGLSVAALDFPGNAYYYEYKDNKDNITPFEFIPWILAGCKTAKEAWVLLKRINIVNIAFSENLPLSPLHWIIVDGTESVVVESRKDGLYIHNNPIGVLTNNPPFEYHLKNLEKYKNLRADNSKITRQEKTHYDSYSKGLGAVGLPGDVSSMSRFVRAVFGLRNSVCDGNELSSVGQFFHLLTSVEKVRGTCKTDEGALDITSYSSCVNTKRGLYYYVTYGNRQINCVDMHKTDLNSCNFSRFPLILEQNVNFQN